jgi:Xaa-Pro aminopeptidase
MFQSFDVTAKPDLAAKRVKSLRLLFAKRAIDAYLIPRADEHQGEYVPASAERLKWLTGFSGSAGMAAVAAKRAAVFTDGRYTVQVQSECDGGVFDFPGLARAKLKDWLVETVKAHGVVGYDPWLHTAAEIARLESLLTPHSLRLKPVPGNLVDKIWGKDRPSPPAGRVVPHPMQYAGKAAIEKIADLQTQLKAARQDAVVLTLPDSICWLLNIRGSDVAHNPVVLAFAIVPVQGKAELYIAPAKIDKDARRYLDTVTKTFAPEKLDERLEALKRAGKVVRVDYETAAFAIVKRLVKSATKGGDPCIAMKALKNAAEMSGARAAHVRDGLAVSRFLAWLDGAAKDGALDEITAVKTLERMRRDSQRLLEISFDTISGSGANGAIVHYRVSADSNRTIKPGELFLIDSGAQYSDGTTDITRTVAIGQPTEEMRQRYTAVLKGHIAIATAKFPVGTRGIDLDPFARRALWDLGLDYDHGTGHGVGSYLSVHEGPQSISRGGLAELLPGMIISNEPGYYKQGAYGIRIENLILVTAPEMPAGGDRRMMGFETLTLVPFDLSLIDAAILSAVELSWINGYHAHVRATLADEADAATKAWLLGATAPIKA